MQINTAQPSRTKTAATLNAASTPAKTASAAERSTPADSFTPSPQLQKLNNAIGVMDRGTAANTTLYLDKSSFWALANESTFGNGAKWEELGVDNDKRWVVINGQRFEYRFTGEEKAERKRAQENGAKSLLDYIKEFEVENQEREKTYRDDNKTIPIRDELGKISFTDEQLAAHPKLATLKNNPEVMELLENIDTPGRPLQLWG